MSGNIIYAFNPDQIVWVISECGDIGALTVLTGVVQRVNATVTSETKVWYDILVNGFVRETFNEEDIFNTLSAAMVEYELRLS